MIFSEIVKRIDAKVLTMTSPVTEEILYAFTSDLMSDVLTVEQQGMMLVSGLSNLQVIRTAEVSDIGFVVIGRNKEVSEDMIALANSKNIVLMQSEYSLFRISGILYEAGLKPLF